jgi:hypothetical protein
MAEIAFVALTLAVITYATEAKPDSPKTTPSQEGSFDFNKEGYCSRLEEGRIRITIEHAPQYYSTARFPKKDSRGEDMIDGKCYCFNGHIVFQEKGELSGIVDNVHNVNLSTSGCGAD